MLPIVASNYSPQSEVRRVYRDLVESDDRTFTGFDLGSSNGYVLSPHVLYIVHPFVFFPSL